LIPIAKPDLSGNELAYLTECITSGWVSQRGEFVRKFEAALADWCGVRFGVATSSGTGALHLALAALGIGPGDEVIVPALTYAATANVVLYTGARPIFVDSDPDTWNMDLNKIPAQISPATRAILAVHLFGHPLDMDKLMRIATQYGLWVIEDACEAHGASVRGRRVGGLGQIGCFSFYGNKLITTGEGGMLMTDSAEIESRARSLRNQAAADDKYRHEQIGFNYRMTNLQAAVGLAQFERVDEFIIARRKIAVCYDELLAEITGVSLYCQPEWAQGMGWMYSLTLTDEYPLSRDELLAEMARCGVECKPFFQPLPTMPAYKDGRNYPVAADLARRGLSLPTFVGLRSEQAAQVTGHIRKQATR
jgi:perosamine synthetase